VVTLTQESLETSTFDPSNPVIILAHGWNSHGRMGADFGERFAPAYLEIGDFNVFSIDWGDLESWANYPKAATTTRPVGKHAAKLVSLINQAGVDVSNIHGVGHSLGAHVVGFMGKEIQSLGLGKLGRITGLDPAKPFFELATDQDRIDRDDAVFVDIIHTNSGNLWDGCLSFPQALGHIDFYPAGGEHQPGCTEGCVGTVCWNATIEDLIKGGCSHDRANQYFLESIQSTGFLASSCNTWEDWLDEKCCGSQEEVMGHWLTPTYPEKVNREFYLMVDEEEPYAWGQDGLPTCAKDKQQEWSFSYN